MKAKEIKKENLEQTVEETQTTEVKVDDVTTVYVGDHEEIKRETEKIKFKDKHPKIAKALKLTAAIGTVIGVGAIGYKMGSKNKDSDIDYLSYDDTDQLSLPVEEDNCSEENDSSVEFTEF